MLIKIIKKYFEILENKKILKYSIGNIILAFVLLVGFYRILGNFKEIDRILNFITIILAIGAFGYFSSQKKNTFIARRLLIIGIGLIISIGLYRPKTTIDDNGTAMNFYLFVVSTFIFWFLMYWFTLLLFKILEDLTKEEKKDK